MLRGQRGRKLCKGAEGCEQPLPAGCQRPAALQGPPGCVLSWVFAPRSPCQQLRAETLCKQGVIFMHLLAT